MDFAILQPSSTIGAVNCNAGSLIALNMYFLWDKELKPLVSGAIAAISTDSAATCVGCVALPSIARGVITLVIDFADQFF